VTLKLFQGHLRSETKIIFYLKYVASVNFCSTTSGQLLVNFYMDMEVAPFYIATV